MENLCILNLYWNNLFILQKSVNGQVTIEKPSPIKKSISTKTDAVKKAVPKPDDIEGKLKERKQEDNKISVTKKDKDQVVVKVGKENKVEQVKNKKNIKNLFQEKPVDFDEGNILLNIFKWLLK